MWTSRGTSASSSPACTAEYTAIWTASASSAGVTRGSLVARRGALFRLMAGLGRGPQTGRGRGDHPADGGDQFLGRERLGEHRVDADLVGAEAVAGRRRRGDEDQRDVPAVLGLAQSRGGGEA